jgi:hypothetical protein
MSHLGNSIVSGVPASVLFRTTPCEWTLARNRSIAVVRDGKVVHPEKFVLKKGDPTRGKIVDSRTVLEEFLLDKTKQEWLDFLNSYGCFGAKLPGASLWGYEEFQSWQVVFKELIQRHPSTWKGWFESVPTTTKLIRWALKRHTEFLTEFRWRGNEHSLVIKANDILTAVIATVYLDHLRGANYKFCALSDCRKPFELTSKHDRIYCSQRCAHLQTVRKQREQNRSRKKRGQSRAKKT